MKSNTRPSTFGFRDGKFQTTVLLHVALLRALGFKAERQERDGSGAWWFEVSGTGASDITLEQAVTGIHDPRCLDGSEADKVQFFKLAQEHYRTLLQEVKSE